MSLRATAACCFLFVVVGIVPAYADEPSDDELGAESLTQEDELDDEAGDIERAEEHFAAGAEHYYESNYGRAAVQFRRAQEAHPHPLFLYNFALAAVQLDRYDDALEAAEEARTMDVDLPPEQNARNSGLIESLNTILLTHNIVEDFDDVDQIVDAPDAIADDGGWGIVGWTGVAAMVAGIGGGILGGLSHHSLLAERDEFEQRQQVSNDEQTLQQMEQRISTREMNRNLYFVGGIGLVGAGVGMIIWESQTGSTDAAPDATAVDITVGPTGAGMTYQW